MASGSITPLSLAYLIEISFVINLAYHELNTFKLRDSIKASSDQILEPYKNNKMHEGYESLVEPEWSHVSTFHNGIDKAAWESKWFRSLYSFFLYSCRDRKIVRYLLATDIFILILCTICADVMVYGSADLPRINMPITFLDIQIIDAPPPVILWWAGLSVLVASIIIPGLFMLLGRKCNRYVYGYVDEEVNDGKGVGRIKQLEQKFLEKYKQIDKLRFNVK